MHTEVLEDRSLLAVVWANEAAAMAPNGSFTLKYGSFASAAQTIVNHAISDWNRILTTPQGVSLTINADNIGSAGTLGYTDNFLVESSGLKRPVAAEIVLDDNAAGGNWYFDPSPASDLEFSDMLTIYTASSPTVSVYDFESTVLHEIGHAVGMSWSGGGGFFGIENYLSASPLGSNFRTFSGSGYTVEMSVTSGLHVSDAADSNDLMSATMPTGTRSLISQLDAKILRDAYGYSWLDPQQVDTMYVNQEPDGTIYVKGFAGSFDDAVTVYGVTNPPAAFYSIAVNGTAEVPPTGPIVIQTGNGNDTVTMDATSGYLWQQMTINGGNGDDTLIYNGGGTGNNYRYHFTNNLIGRTHKTNPTTPYAVSSYSDFTRVRLLATGSNDDVEVTGSSGAAALELYLGDGTNYLNGGGATYPIRAFGGTGDDTFIGGSAADILSTLGGNDTIAGNGGRDLVFLGSGSDQIGINNDSATDDLIVMGNTSYDGNIVALLALRSEWLSANSASVRKSHILGTTSGGLNGSYTLVLNTTLFVDGQADVIHVDANDWYLANNGLDTIFFDS